MINSIAIGILSAVCYALLFFFKSGETFNPAKFISTIIVGAIVGLYFTVYNKPITEETIFAQLLYQGAVIVLFENVIKVLWRFIFGRR